MGWLTLVKMGRMKTQDWSKIHTQTSLQQNTAKCGQRQSHQQKAKPAHSKLCQPHSSLPSGEGWNVNIAFEGFASGYIAVFKVLSVDTQPPFEEAALVQPFGHLIHRQLQT